MEISKKEKKIKKLNKRKIRIKRKWYRNKKGMILLIIQIKNKPNQQSFHPKARLHIMRLIILLKLNNQAQAMSLIIQMTKPPNHWLHIMRLIILLKLNNQAQAMSLIIQIKKPLNVQPLQSQDHHHKASKDKLHWLHIMRLIILLKLNNQSQAMSLIIQMKKLLRFLLLINHNFLIFILLLVNQIFALFLYLSIINLPLNLLNNLLNNFYQHFLNLLLLPPLIYIQLDLNNLLYLIYNI